MSHVDQTATSIGDLVDMMGHVSIETSSPEIAGWSHLSDTQRKTIKALVTGFNNNKFDARDIRNQINTLMYPTDKPKLSPGEQELIDEIIEYLHNDTLKVSDIRHRIPVLRKEKRTPTERQIEVGKQMSRLHRKYPDLNLADKMKKANDKADRVLARKNSKKKNNKQKNK
jgi:hypothetical protein